MNELKVAVDARCMPGTHGGTESVLIGLAQGFHEISPTDVRISFVTYRGHSDWLRDLTQDSFRTHEVDLPGPLDKMLGRGRVWALRFAAGSYGKLPRHDWAIESVRSDVVHFPLQNPGWVRQPYIYHPHDLQHRHLPEFFTKRQRASRDVMYAAHCRRAAVVAVGTTWVKDDLVSQLGVKPDKISIVALAPIASSRDGGSPSIHPHVPTRYVIYPAAAWPHKNHGRLLAAVATLRSEGLDIPLVLTGVRPQGTDLNALARAAGVGDLVHDLGHIPQADLEVLISNAVAMVVPTLFEAASFPIWESFKLGTPVACSTVTSLPRQVGDAAVTFDPRSLPEMAAALRVVWADPIKGRELVERGQQRLSELSWASTASHFLALYRLLGGRALSPDDRHLLTRAPSL